MTETFINLRAFARGMGNKQSAVVTVIIAVAIVAILGYLVSTQGVKPAATVNGVAITQKQVDEASAGSFGASREAVLEQLINRELLIQEASAQGFVPTDAEVQAEYNKAVLSFPSQQAFQEALDAANLTKEQVMKDLKDRMSITRYLEATIMNVTATDEELRAYYDAHIGEFTAAQGQIHVAHILLTTEEEAEEVFEKLKKGADYRELAANYSLDPNAAATGGDLGIISRGQTIKEFEDAAFSLKVGEASEPVQTIYGSHIIIRLRDTITFEEAKRTIRELVENDKREQALEARLAELRAKATIVYAVPPPNQFAPTGDTVCEEGGKPIIRMYASSSCPTCPQMATLLQTLGQNDFVMKVWELDTGDNLDTVETESSLTKEEFAILRQYNPGGKVPAYVLGCRYVRLGNARDPLNLTAEREALSPLLDELA